jgi:ribosomal protein S18 acetylase RimI-like enzyme
VARTEVRPYDPAKDRAWAERVLIERLGGAMQVVHGELFDVLAEPGLVAERDGGPVGYLAYVPAGDEWQLLALAAVGQWAGTGTALVEGLVALAGGRPIWLVTTNDNVDALRFYQRRGFRLTALRPGAVDESRERFKAEIPSAGDLGIPLHDEIELEKPV